MKQKLIKLQEKIDMSITMVMDTNNALSILKEQNTINKISKDIRNVNIIQEIDLIDVCRIHHTRTAVYTLSLNLLRIYTKIDPIKINNMNFNKFKRIQILQWMFITH